MGKYRFKRQWYKFKKKRIKKKDLEAHKEYMKGMHFRPDTKPAEESNEPDDKEIPF